MYYLMIIKLQKAAKAYCLWFKGKNLIQNFGPISFYQIFFFYQILEGWRVIILNSNLRLINYMIFFKYIDFFSNRESIN